MILLPCCISPSYGPYGTVRQSVGCMFVLYIDPDLDFKIHKCIMISEIYIVLFRDIRLAEDGEYEREGHIGSCTRPQNSVRPSPVKNHPCRLIHVVAMQY